MTRSSGICKALSNCGIRGIFFHSWNVDIFLTCRLGLSDPFCEVKVGGRKRYVTSIKKKTLSPVWDELVTTEMPKQNETLEIVS